MPPPYWRGSSASFHVETALGDLVSQMHEWIRVHARTHARLDEYFDKNPEPSDDEADEEFEDICEPLWDLEHAITLKAELASLMSAIGAEEEVNRFAVYNLHRDISESIERLSPPEKLLIVSASAGKPGLKSNSLLEAIRKLASWRNTFVHGHCVDRPTKSLRINHLVHPDQYSGVLGAISTMRELVGAHLRISDYLRSISVNPYTGERSENVETIRILLAQLADYHLEGDNYVYNVVLKPTALQKVEASIRRIALSHRESAHAKLDDFLATLEPLDAKLIRLEFGLGGEAYTGEQVASLLGLDASYFQQRRAVALTRLSSAGLEETPPAV
jgi:hypothetical protein